MRTKWFKDAVIYQIYPRSFMDGNGDGIGDIRGIISRLDYIKDLGVDAVWLSPVYKSPNDDNGYDISDYKDIMSDFGTLDDWKEMIDGLHLRGVRLIMDLVVNHTSDEHPWFIESRKSVNNPYRDYYIWAKGKGKDGRKPPNNWTSRFVGPAWEYDEATNEWYLHLFSKKQPDLNWDNPKVRQEVIDICNYWFDLGVDGFRCDVITYISKDMSLPNGKFNIALVGDEHFVLGPNCHKYLNELYTESWSRYDSMIVGEAIGIKFEDAPSLIDNKRGELDSIFNFEHMETDMYMQFLPHKFKLSKFKKVMSKWQSLPTSCWNSLYLENHDQPRTIPRFVSLKYRKQGAKMLALMLLMQKGTPYIYQGQEIGMTNCKFRKDEYIDIMAKRIFSIAKKFPPFMPIAKYAMARRARDHARTPMQWDDTENAGFSKAEPWMKINPNYTGINVKEAMSDPDSILNFYKRIISFRKGNEIIKEGSYLEYYGESDDIYVYERAYGNKKLLIITSFRDYEVKFIVPDALRDYNSQLIISNYPDSGNKLSDMTLRPYEAVMYSLTE
ncbi:MAG: alpha-glucosidase [Christensenellales bacterium]|jgi:oligo-1,6-glucosidase